MNPGGLVQKNPVNETSGKHIHNYSTFDRSLSYRLYNTLRFGDYVPSFIMEGVENDEISVNTLDRIDSLSLNAPFKGSIRKIKESFKVPFMAILPFQWDRIYAQNSNGDDVPDDANCVIDDFPFKFGSYWRTLCAAVADAASGFVSDGDTKATYGERADANFFTALMRLVVLGEYVYSSGSLLNVCGYKANSQFFYSPLDADGSRSAKSYDWWFDQILSHVFSYVSFVNTAIPKGGEQVAHGAYFGLNPDVEGQNLGSFRSLIELFRENPLATITGVYWNSDKASDAYDMISALADETAYGVNYLFDGNFKFPFSDLRKADPSSIDDVDDMPYRLNLSRLLAYQLICAHFFTNSSIDFIYSAELYRQYISDLEYHVLEDLDNDSLPFKFSWNGLDLMYDYLSGHLLNIFLFAINDTEDLESIYSDLSLPVFSGTGGSLASSLAYSYAIWSAIFGFRKSLRYGDYFVSSRPRPLAPINTDVAVNNSMVSVIDITRSIQAQRFANSVMRTRSKIEDYVKGLFGKAPAPDYHNPFYLIRQEEVIFGDEVQNTAESQVNNPNSRTANFAGNVSQHTFTFHNDDMHPCIYMQIISFDIRRAYTRSVERQFLHQTRFDMFNPDFQYIGDQPIYGIELGYTNPTQIGVQPVFGYTTRDMEYKQRYDQACSGFVENLPGWILTDRDRSIVPVRNLDPDFIRSYNTELDQFFISLTGFSLASYFHFICITDNNVHAKRAMAVDPQILA